jgi:hypothetical protein
MMTIYKYPLRPDLQTLRLPADAEILCVQMQRGEPQVWVKLDTDKPLVTRTLCVYGTGHEMKGLDSHYIGTFQLMGGELIFHVFEEKI